MSVNRPTSGQGPASDQTMLLLSLRGRTGCRWVPVLILFLFVAVGAVGASYRFGLWSPGGVPGSLLDGVSTPTRTEEVAHMVTPTFTAEATVEPAASPTLAPSPTPTGTPEVSPTQAPVSTPTLQVTATPPDLPTATSTWTPTPAVTPTVTTSAVSVDATLPGTACEPSVVSTIERAAEAQASYMEGKLDAASLAAAWGGAAADARIQAERMMTYRAGDILGVEVTDVEWSVSNCRARVYEGWVQVSVSEEWRYAAQLTCASGAAETSVWSEAFPSETYALVRDSDGWRIRSWRIQAPETQTRWRCSASQ